jgi:hypothetical protein
MAQLKIPPGADAVREQLGAIAKSTQELQRFCAEFDAGEHLQRADVGKLLSGPVLNVEAKVNRVFKKLEQRLRKRVSSIARDAADDVAHRPLRKRLALLEDLKLKSTLQAVSAYDLGGFFTSWVKVLHTAQHTIPFTCR